MTSPRPSAAPAEPAWTAATVARRLGVSPATLRSWSARYGTGPSGHEAGRYRRYTSADLAELETIQLLRREGMAMAQAAAVARERRSAPGTFRRRGEPDTAPERDHRTREDGTIAWPAEVAALVSAVRALDAQSAVRLVESGLVDRGVVDTWNELCRPALAATTTVAPAADGPSAPAPAEWATQELDSDTGAGPIDAECILVWAITTGLRRISPLPAGPEAPGVLLACAHGELHSLALDALLAALHQQRLAARTLGPSVPTPALHHAAERTRPKAIFVWAHTASTARPAALHDLERHTGTVVAVGPGWDIAALPRHVRTAQNLEQALALAGASTT